MAVISLALGIGANTAIFSLLDQVLLAKKYFGDQTALGRHFGFGGDPGTKTDIEIVAVVKDAKYVNMRDSIPMQDFVPYDQMEMMTSVTFYTLILRTFTPKPKRSELTKFA